MTPESTEQNTPLTVMSFNLRYDTPRDGDRQFSLGRGAYIVDYLLNRCDADVIGFQELNDSMRAFLEPRIAARYALVGVGRNEDYTGEASAIAYRQDRFTLLGLDTFWLSPTPAVPGSRPLGQRLPRICTVATLLPKEGTRPFRFYNTHLFHNADERLRYAGISMILERIRRDAEFFSCPVVLTGDFNATPDSITLEAIRVYEPIRLTDASAELGPTYHEYENPELTPSKIDYIWTTAPFDPASAARVTERRAEDGMFLSDHYPIRATIRV